MGKLIDIKENFDAYIRRAEECSNDGRLSAAVVAARNACKHSPTLDNRLLLIEIYMKADAPEMAIQECINGIIEDRDLPDYMFALVTCLNQTADFSAAEYYLEYLKTLIDMSDYEIDVEDYDFDAKNYVDRSKYTVVYSGIEDEKDNLRLAKRALDNKKYRLAIKYLSKINKKSPKYSTVLSNMAEISANLIKDENLTEKYAKDILEREPNDLHALLLLIQNSKDESIKRELYARAEQAENFEYDDLYRQTVNATEAFDLEMTLQCFGTFLSKHPYDRFLMQMIAFLYFKKGRRDEAIRIYKKLNTVYDGKFNYNFFVEMLEDNEMNEWSFPLILNTDFIAKKLTFFLMSINDRSDEQLIDAMHRSKKFKEVVLWQIRMEHGDFFDTITNFLLGSGTREGFKYFTDALKDVTVSENFKCAALYEYCKRGLRDKLDIVNSNKLRKITPVYVEGYDKLPLYLRRAYSIACSESFVALKSGCERKLKIALSRLIHELKRPGKGKRLTNAAALASVIIMYANFAEKDTAGLIKSINAYPPTFKRYQKELQYDDAD